MTRSVRSTTRVISGLMALILATAGLVVGIAISPAAAASPLTLTATATPSILAGAPATVTLTATNGGAVDYFNASFEYVMQQGQSYVAGSARGADGAALSNPRIITITDTTPSGTHQILIFDNAADLAAGLAAPVVFQVATTQPVGSAFSGTGSVYTNTNPRLVAKFDAVGVASNFDNSADAPPSTGSSTHIEAIEVTKSEPSPEHELMRGVHTQQQTYTIVTKNTTQGPTSGIVIVDYLPAELEFLGCSGNKDNTTGGTEEYPGSGRLVTTAGGPNCLTPTSVATIDNRPGFPVGVVFTEVTYTLGDLAAGASATITYAAGIPLFANAMFPAATKPTDISGLQGSNLDNNTGLSTRQLAGGAGLTNTAVGTGNYQGAVATPADRATTSTSSVTVKAMDLSIVKTTASPNFSADSTGHFQFLVRSSEYTADSAMTIVDTIPDGLCPLVPGIVNNSGSALPAGCVVTTGTVTNATVDSTVANADGTFTMTLTPTPTTIPTNTSLVIRYDAYEGTTYRGNGSTAPVAAGDSFQNTVTIVGSSRDQTGADTTVQQSPEDDSSATIVSGGPSIEKKILPRPVPASGTAVDCAAATGYTHADPGTGGTIPTYLLGDKVCFQLTVHFSTAADTRNARVTDFVPVGTTYDDYQLAAGTTVTVTPVAGSQSAYPTASRPTNATPAAWNLGDARGSTGRFVTKDSSLTFYVSAIVTSLSSTTAVDITANLMKYREASTNNTVLALRDSVDYGLAPAPVVALAKGVTSVTTAGQRVSYSPASKNATVTEGDVVAFSLDVANSGTPANGNAVNVDNLQLWDALPAGYDCLGWNVQVTGGVCLDPSNSVYPANSATPAGRSIIVATSTGPLAAGDTRTALTYTVTVPATVSVSTLFSNTGSVVAFTSPNTAGGNTDFFPKGSLNPDHVTDGNTTKADDTAQIGLAPAVASKSGVTSITGPNNTLATQAVPGESVTYTYAVTVPAGTTVFNGVLSDPVPTGLKLPPSPSFTATMNNGPLPSGVTLNQSTGTLSFGMTYNNSNAPRTDQTFSVVAAGLVVTPGLTPGSSSSITSITNIANFTSTATTSTTSTPLSQDRSYTVDVVNPLPKLAKTVDKALAAGGETVTFTLAASNTAGRPGAFDPTIVDCLPSGLHFVSSSPTAPVSTAPCAGGTEYTFSVASPLPYAADASSTITLTATVDPTSAGLTKYTNTATVTTSSLSNDVTDPSIESVQTAKSSAVVTVQGATTVKTVTPTKPTVGQTVDYTVTVTVPPNETFYNASIIDGLPTGIAFISGSDTVTCAPAAGCASPASTRLTNGVVTASGQNIGWALGDLSPYSSARTFTVTFSGLVTVADPTNVAGTSRTNSAHLSWDTSAFATPPSTADAAFDATGDAGTAALVVTEPLLSIAKTVSTSKPAPGDIFTYTLTVSNAATPNRSTAFSPVVTDCLPAGIVFISATPAPTSNASCTGGTRYTFALPDPIAPGGSSTISYTTKLAASSTLGVAALTNSAEVPSYSSLATGGRSYDNVTPATAVVTPAFPKITLAKPQPNPSTAYRGQSFNSTVRATNTGQGAAKTVVMTDVLPADWTYDTSSAFATVAGAPSTQVDPTITTDPSTRVQTLSWSFGTLPVRGVILIAYSSTPSATAATGASRLQTNTLTASATDNTDATGNAAGAYSTDTKTATAHIDSADITVAKAAGDPLIAGTTVAKAWTITMTNTGPDQAVGTSGSPFTVTDSPQALPTGVTITSASGTGWSCSTPTSAGEFTCTRIGTLNNGAAWPAISVSATVASSVPNGTAVTNTATGSALTFDPTVSTDTRTITVVTAADLAITKTVNGTPRAGAPVSWTIGVVNLGPSDSAGPITVTDTLPATGLTNATATGAGWSCATTGSSILCTRTGPLPIGPANSITVTADLASSFTGTLTNSATVAGANNTNAANDTASTSTAADTTTAMTLSKTLLSPVTSPATTAAIVPGQNAVYRFTVTNTGTADARTVVITDPLPAGLSYIASSAASADPWTCTGTTTVTCTLHGTLPATTGNVSTLDITVNTPPTITADVTNTAVATSANAPSATGVAPSPSSPRANFSITKSHPAGTVLAGTAVTYTLTARNLGPSDSPGQIVVTDTLPSGMTATVASVSGSGWACGVTGQVITCTRAAALAAGVTAPPISATVTIDPNAGPATLVNVATVDGPIPSTDTSRAATTDNTVITDRSDVTIMKTATSGPTAIAGTNATYALTVHNAGPSTADSLLVSDLLPVGTTAVSIAGVGWTCTLASLTCSRATLAPGDSVITVRVRIAASVAPGSVLTNSATVDWVENGVPRTGTDAASITVTADADLAITKAAVSPTVNAGDTASYAIGVTNAGPSDAAGSITVVDTLPVGLSYLSSSSAWNCTAATPTSSGQPVTCVLGSGAGLATGAVASTLTITTQVDSTLAAGTLTNSAVVSSPTTDSNLTDNTATASLQVGQSADLSIAKTHTGSGTIGDITEFTIAVQNIGPSTATGVTVTDTLPRGLTYVDATNSDPAWSCVAAVPDQTAGTTTVICTLASPIAAAAAAPALRVRATVEAIAYPSVTNTAAVESTTADPNATNNTSTDALAISALVRLGVVKTHVGQLVVGQNAHYVIAVTNSGPTEDPGGFFIIDTLPSSLRYLSSSGTGVTCAVSGQTVTCTFAGALSVGKTRSVTLVVAVLPGAYPQITNTATVASLAVNLATLADSASSDVGAVTVPATTLSFTGVNLNRWLLALTALLILLGAVLVLYTRRRRHL